MKNIIRIIAFNTFIGLSFAACNQENKSATANADKVNMHTETKKPQAETPTNSSNSSSTASISEIVKGYLALKNALTADKTKEAATTGAALQAAIKNFDQNTLSVEQKKVFADVADDAVEHAEHIGSNGGNIAHQREHFDTLSKDIYALAKSIGAGQTLYQDFCPMYNDKKGAIWLSETKDINNPYYGKKMATCGSMKEELK